MGWGKENAAAQKRRKEVEREMTAVSEILYFSLQSENRMKQTYYFQKMREWMTGTTQIWIPGNVERLPPTLTSIFCVQYVD